MAKFAKDAATETELHRNARMDREGARYIHAELQLNDCAMTEEEEHDLEAAKRGAYARRWHLLGQMTKTEQLAYKPRRT